MRRFCYILAGLTLAGCSDSLDSQLTRIDDSPSGGWDRFSAAAENRAETDSRSTPSGWLSRPRQKPSEKKAQRATDKAEDRRPHIGNRRVRHVERTKPATVANRDQPNQEKRETPEEIAKVPIVKAPLTKRVAGIDWHTSLDAALGEASREQPAGGKPVLCYRVLGDMTGFM